MPKYKLIQSMKQNFAVIMNTLSDIANNQVQTLEICQYGYLDYLV